MPLKYNIKLLDGKPLLLLIALKSVITLSESLYKYYLGHWPIKYYFKVDLLLNYLFI